MDTTSITHIHEMETEFCKKEEIVCSFFRRFDGNPQGMGKDLAEFLKDKKLVGGKTRGLVKGRDFNRAGTISIPLMSYIQNIADAETRPAPTLYCGVDYVYDVFFRHEEFVIKTTYMRKKLSYEQSASDFNPFNVAYMIACKEDGQGSPAD